MPLNWGALLCKNIKFLVFFVRVLKAITYFSNTTSIDNLFSTKEYGSTIEEIFVSPDNWLPGGATV